MTGLRFATILTCALLVVAGCTASPGGPGASPTDSPADRDGTPPTADDTPTGTPKQVPYEAVVFDHVGPTGTSAIEGGIRYVVDEEYTTRHYVTVVDSATDAERFDHSVLESNASAFVNGTDFGRASLVVIQTFPGSSVPDYRVESVTRSDGALQVRVNRSSRFGTADITVETVLLRVQDETLDSVTVTTAQGTTFSTSTGVVTVTPEPTPTPEPSVELPYASDDPAENLDEARGLRVVNAGEDVNGFNVTVTYIDRPDCRDDETPCEIPTRLVEIYSHFDKLRPGTNHTVERLARRTGNYTVTVNAFVPGGDGSRRTVSEQFHWHLDETSGDLVVWITDDGLTIRESPSK